ncbi:MAG: prephenate dehydratase [Drouetiella hepatica Uher 2000/2452]|jgi:prephenate dehydratase|uniref:Prephenate dehydratase n=1 Tax=Drouetiella hepatica Uher 2000/2452 TaxID=904376 RepID=A0A951Q9J2_9CYAN|nr:prephenate dehydratase [Drouetiella hepatica Uher 2000/2452]
MDISIAHLGPAGTYAESAALAYSTWLEKTTGNSSILHSYASIAQAIRAAAQGETQMAVVPVENSIEGSVTVTLDTLWQLDKLHIQQALILPIAHALLSTAPDLGAIEVVYSHPQALAQCQAWLEQYLPAVPLVPTNSTTEALQYLKTNPQAGAISSQRAAQLYELPILAYPINDHPDNCTRFWVLSLEPPQSGSQTSLAFSLPANTPGALLKPLQIFAQRQINMSRIESRPTKRSLGDYLFFIDLEANLESVMVQSALAELQGCTETIKILGSYDILSIE